MTPCANSGHSIMRDAFIRVLMESAAQDPRIVLITGDLGFAVLTEFAARFPKQYLNAGVAEQNMTAIACGMALEGHKVFTYSIANFTTLRCLEQLRNDVCYHKADVTAVSVGGGFSYGQLGMSHFATEDLAILRALPDMTVLAPTGIWEAEEATRALVKGSGPAYLRLDKGLAASLPRDGETFAIGKSRRLRDGRDVCLIASGAVLSEALKAADLLAMDGIHTRVISMHTVKPLDIAAVAEAARECGGIVTMEEHTVLGGLGGAVAEACLEEGAMPGFFIRVGLDDLFPSVVGDQDYLRGVHGITAQAAADRIRARLSHAKGR
jgi:transketolase